MKVGSSKVQKTDVRIVAATNIKMDTAIKKNKFREDLYYRLSTVEINIPPLRKRKNDIFLLFRKFASDFAKKYKMPTVRLDEEAQLLLKNYRWNGNIRQLKNITEQLSVLEQSRAITKSILSNYLPNPIYNLPALIDKESHSSDFSSEREILYKILFDMKKDLNELKKDIGKIKSDNPDFDISSFKNPNNNYTDELIEKTELKNSLIPVNENLIDKLSTKPIKDKIEKFYKLKNKDAGQLSEKKVSLLTKILIKKNVDIQFISSSENIAWLLNIRGEDSSFAPIPNCYLTIDKYKKIYLFCEPKKISKDIGKHNLSSIGIVTGATYPKELEHIRKKLPYAPFLIPGFGKQGGSIEDARRGLLPDKKYKNKFNSGIINSSRG